MFMSCFCTVHARLSHLLFILVLTFCNTYHKLPVMCHTSLDF